MHMGVRDPCEGLYGALRVDPGSYCVATHRLAPARDSRRIGSYELGRVHVANMTMHHPLPVGVRHVLKSHSMEEVGKEITQFPWSMSVGSG